MNILFVAAEASPLVKVGGLAEVVGSLPKALNELGHDVRIMLPHYGAIDVNEYKLLSVIDDFTLELPTTLRPFSLSVVTINDELKVYLVGNDEFLSSKDVYGADELRRFLLFEKAVVEVVRRLDWQPDIVHCHDWHTALVPMWLKKGNWGGALLFTIHNLVYQGSFDNNFLTAFGLFDDWQGQLFDLPYNFISQGIVWADMITTVSENYAKEIVTSEYGAGLEQLLRCRQDRLVGIVNGIDYDEYNPSTDRFIAANYDFTRLGTRLINKRALQRKMGLPEDDDVLLIGMVTRLDEQKGLDIVIDSFPLLFGKKDVQVVILGKGREYYQRLLRKAVKKYPHSLAVSNEFDEALAHLIYAGCDIFLMPSRFEPCGLGQLMAMRYGAIPLVRHTGGLVDTVKDLSADLGRGSGFVFKEHDVGVMVQAVLRAVNAYRGKQSWRAVMQRIMSLDFSWQKSARKYEAVYQRALELSGCVPK